MHVSIEESSQFASALLLCAKDGGWEVEVVGENAEESPYVAMTSKLIEAFPNQWWQSFKSSRMRAAGVIFGRRSGYAIIFEWTPNELSAKLDSDDPPVRVKHWPKSGWQIDDGFSSISSAACHEQNFARNARLGRQHHDGNCSGRR